MQFLPWGNRQKIKNSHKWMQHYRYVWAYNWEIWPTSGDQEVMVKERRQVNGPTGVRTFQAEEPAGNGSVAGTQRLRESLWYGGQRIGQSRCQGSISLCPFPRPTAASMLSGAPQTSCPQISLPVYSDQALCCPKSVGISIPHRQSAHPPAGP